MQSRWLEYCKEILCISLGRQNGYVQALLIAPILAIGFLGFIVRAANPAVDPSFAKNEVTAQVQQRLNEIQQRSDVLGHVEPASTVTYPTSEEKEDTVPPVLVTLPPLPEPVTPIGTSHHIVHAIKPHETFAGILKKEGLSPQQTAAWISAAQQRAEVRRLQIGRTITFSYESDHNGTPTLRTVSCSINQHTSLVFEQDESGHIQSRIETAPTTLVWRAVGGRITHSLGRTARKIGVPASIIDAVADMGWDLNLSYDLQPGDPFKIVFEEIQHNGQAVKHGRVLAAEIVNKGERHLVFPLDAEEGIGGGRRFLRYPVRFTRISSVFSDARLHPIYKRKRPHRGVDFAAPTGTPVRAVADGKVTYAGWRGDYGRFLKIAHAGPYSSAYAHLRRIKKGVRAGAFVKRGQVIGYVGSSGAATGPHLHFEMHKNGRYINPLKKMPTQNVFAGQKRPPTARSDPQLAAIRKKLEEYLARLSVQNGPESRIYTAIPRIQTAASEAVEPQA